MKIRSVCSTLVLAMFASACGGVEDLEGAGSAILVPNPYGDPGSVPAVTAGRTCSSSGEVIRVEGTDFPNGWMVSLNVYAGSTRIGGDAFNADGSTWIREIPMSGWGGVTVRASYKTRLAKTWTNLSPISLQPCVDPAISVTAEFVHVATNRYPNDLGQVSVHLRASGLTNQSGYVDVTFLDNLAHTVAVVSATVDASGAFIADVYTQPTDYVNQQACDGYFWAGVPDTASAYTYLACPPVGRL